MGRKKLLRLESNITRSNLYQDTRPDYFSIKSNWHKDFFRNDKPIVLELGCGKGEYSVALAQMYPDKNFIGVDVKGDRLAVGCEKADTLMLNNLAFLRCNILQIEQFFSENEVSEIWITFPDPHIRKRDIRKRMTHERFLKMYQNIMHSGGLLHLKTDSLPLFQFSLESLQAFGVADLDYTYDLYNSSMKDIAKNIRTRFEEIFTEKGFNIKFLMCKMLK